MTDEHTALFTILYYSHQHERKSIHHHKDQEQKLQHVNNKNLNCISNLKDTANFNYEYDLSA